MGWMVGRSLARSLLLRFQPPSNEESNGTESGKKIERDEEEGREIFEKKKRKRQSICVPLTTNSEKEGKRMSEKKICGRGRAKNEEAQKMERKRKRNESELTPTHGVGRVDDNRQAEKSNHTNRDEVACWKIRSVRETWTERQRDWFSLMGFDCILADYKHASPMKGKKKERKMTSHAKWRKKKKKAAENFEPPASIRVCLNSFPRIGVMQTWWCNELVNVPLNDWSRWGNSWGSGWNWGWGRRSVHHPINQEGKQTKQEHRQRMKEWRNQKQRREQQKKEMRETIQTFGSRDCFALHRLLHQNRFDIAVDDHNAKSRTERERKEKKRKTAWKFERVNNHRRSGIRNQFWHTQDQVWCWLVLQLRTTGKQDPCQYQNDNECWEFDSETSLELSISHRALDVLVCWDLGLQTEQVKSRFKKSVEKKQQKNPETSKNIFAGSSLTRLYFLNNETQ